MDTHEIRRAYIAPDLIPADLDAAPGDMVIFELHRFRVEEITPGLLGSLIQGKPADALTVTRRRLLSRAERKQQADAVGRLVDPWEKTRRVRVIAYNGRPVVGADFPTTADALRDAVREYERPQPAGD